MALTDALQKRLGRQYRLKVPRGCGYRLETLGELGPVTLQLDRWAVGEGRRPPLVTFEVAAAQVPAIEAALDA